MLAQQQPPQAVNLHDAKTHFSRLVNRAMAGEDVVIAKAGKPVVKLVPIASAVQRQWGLDAEQGWIADDFDAALPNELMQHFS